LVLSDTKDSTVPATDLGQTVEIFADPKPIKEQSRKKRRKTVKLVQPKATSGGAQKAVEREAPVDVPRIGFAHAGEFQEPWHLALWAPNDPDGPSVRVNVDSHILQESVEYHQRQYPGVYAEEVAKEVRQAFGEIAACKVAHSQKLQKLVPQQTLDADYRSESALTLALMGLLAEEAVIAQRLARLGRKRQAA
jgi:hypothetical protein